MSIQKDAQATISVNRITLDFSRCMTKEVMQIILDKIREDTRRGIGSDGTRDIRFPAHVDLYDTGELMDTAKAEQGRIIWPAAHAKKVNSIWPFNRLSPRQKKEVIPFIKPIIAKLIIKRGTRNGR